MVRVQREKSIDSKKSTAKMFFLLFFLGSLISRKRPELILETIYKIKAGGIVFPVYFLGDGPLRENLIWEMGANSCEK